MMHMVHRAAAINAAGKLIYSPSGNQINPGGAVTSSVYLIIACVVFLSLLFCFPSLSVLKQPLRCQSAGLCVDVHLVRGAGGESPSTGPEAVPVMNDVCVCP